MDNAKKYTISLYGIDSFADKSVARYYYGVYLDDHLTKLVKFIDIFVYEK
jgi:hypothetical protein